MSDINIPNKIKNFNWFTKMAKPQVTQTKVLLDKLYNGKIDMSDYSKKSEEERKNAFYSRALAAFYLYIKAHITVEQSIKSITDGFDDNGIDAIYYDESQSTLYLVQSKLLNEGKGEPETGEMMKFQRGVMDLIDEKFDHFNEKTLKHEESIKDATQDRNTKLIIAIAYTGKGFSVHNTRIRDELMASLNDTTDWAFFDDFNMRAIYSCLLAATSSNPIDYDINLINWGFIEEPFKTYYGQVSAYELAKMYRNEGKKLFNENIRSFIGLSTINTDILKTIQHEPENFIYFNNGVTMICSEIVPIPGKSINKITGGFHCKGVQIVNGAQTVGSLGTALNDYAEQLNKCTVFLRLIPLQDTPEDFGNRLTKASNNQNKIEKKDFVSLDPVQNTLRTELALVGITYHFKRTDEIITPDANNCTLEEATVSLACNNASVYNAVTAKREIGKLWEDINSEPYTLLFNESLKGSVMWNSIKVYREVSKYLNATKISKIQREKSTYTYGNYFILNIMFNIIPKDKIMNPNSDLDIYLNSESFKTLLQKVIDNAYNLSTLYYQTSLIHQLYRNFTKCIDLQSKLLVLAAKNFQHD